MRDIENHRIILKQNPNPHILVWGRSGSGKTYYCYRRIEEAFEEGKRVLILDYSGSYNDKEMQKANFKYIEQTMVFDATNNPFTWMGTYDDDELFQSDLSDAFLAVLNISSYFQKKWMRKAISYHMKTHDSINFIDFIHSLEKLYQICIEENTHREDAKNIQSLLTRFSPYESINGISFKNQKNFERANIPITILQLSSFAETERKFLSNLFITLFWKELVRYNPGKRADLLLLDEFQNLPLSSNGAFCSILREGRRYDIALLLSTQFISNYKKEQIESLLQAGNIFIFQPTDLKFSAKIINVEDSEVWIKILKNLQKGEAILKGHYVLEKNPSRELTRL